MTMKATAVGVEFDGQFRQLFKVEESKDGSLLIFLRHEQMQLEDGNEGEKISTVALSIHPSDASKENVCATITIKSKVHGERLKKAVQKVTGNRKNLLALAYCKSYPNLSHDIYRVSKGKVDRLNIGKFRSEDLSTIMIAVVVCASGTRPQKVNSLSLHIIESDRFKLALYSGYTNFGSTNSGIMASVATSPRIEEGEIAAKDDGIPSISRGKFRKLLLNMMLETMHATVRANNATVPDYLKIAPRTVWFHPSPEHVMQGRINRGEI